MVSVLPVCLMMQNKNPTHIRLSSELMINNELFKTEFSQFFFQLLILIIAHPKFPEGTVAGLYKAAVAVRADQDVLRFDNQNINWTLVEFDRYSSAFAFGLIEAGFEQGDKLVMYVDQTSSAESLVLQMGAIKAGVSLVSF